MSRSVTTTRVLVVSLALVVLDLVVFLQTASHGFITLDDEAYVTKNAHVLEGLTPAGIAWAFTSFDAANWHPLTWMSHMLDVTIFGPDAGAHHIVNLLFHVANTLLLFAWLRRATGDLGRSACVAALFGVHPLHVESVAWVAERKDVLSTLFWWLTIWSYLDYVRQPSRRAYAWMAAAFVCGLLAKPMLVTVPVVLLLLDVWPLKRFRADSWMAMVREKGWLFGAAAASALLTLLAQGQGGAVVTVGQLPLDGRLQNAAVSTVAYLAKAAWPVDLAVFYEFPQAIPAEAVAGAVVVLAAASVLAWRLGRRYPYVRVGWLWYLVTLVPVIGLVQVGAQRMADRYMYVPLVGIFMAVTWGVGDLLRRFAPQLRRLAPVATCAILVACAATARLQASYWKDDLTLWRHATMAEPDSAVVHANFGGLLTNAKQFDEALVELNVAARLNPNLRLINESLAAVHYGRGAAMAMELPTGGAVAEYREAIRLKPDMVAAHHDLGLALFANHRYGEAIQEYSEAIRLEPKLASAYNNRGLAHAVEGRITEALADFDAAVQLAPTLELAHLHRAMALRQLGRLDESVAAFETTLQLNPRNDAAATALAELRRRRQ